MKLRYLKSFATILKTFKDDPIVKEVLKLKGVDNKDLDINWFANSDTPGMICYKSDKKLTNYIKRECGEDWEDEDTRGEYRENIDFVEARVGRIIQKILTLSKKTFSNAEIENFVNRYVAHQKSISGTTFELYTGSDIINIYKRNNYASSKDGNELHQSCMVDLPEGIFDIYTNNTNISALALYDFEHKIIGRCILWNAKLGDKEVKIMDRIYAIKQSDQEIFRKWANENGYMWRYHNGNNYSDCGELFVNKTDKISMKDMTVQLDNSRFLQYPYMDSFRFLDRKNHIISNNFQNFQQKGEVFLDLRNTNGTYQGNDDYTLVTVDGKTVEKRLTRYSNVLSEYLLIEDAIPVYISKDRTEDFISKKTKTTKTKDGRAHFVISNKDGRVYFKSNSVWSKYHNSWILRSEAYYYEKENDFILNDSKRRIAMKNRTTLKKVYKYGDSMPDGQVTLEGEYFMNGVPKRCLAMLSKEDNRWYLLQNDFEGNGIPEVDYVKLGFRRSWVLTANGGKASRIITEVPETDNKEIFFYN